MTIAAKRKKRFSHSRLYRHKEAHAFNYLSERSTFWLAVLSVFTFVTGNMMGQHGWHVFWKSVLGNGIEKTIVFDGTVSPIEKIPDYEKWSRFGGNVRDHSYRQVPVDMLMPLPEYNPSALDRYENVYSVDHLGTYTTGRGNGSHPGVDIAVPEGTPVRSISAGIITRVANDPGGYGNYLVVKHPNAPDPNNAKKVTALYSIYAHLQNSLVEEGQVVKKGEVIAASGQTGLASGPHLHFQMDRDEAPWHPYWPFSTSDARSAGLSFNQAVNTGFGRDNGLLYTTNPMLYVQANIHTQGMQIATEEKDEPAPRERLTVEDRRRARMAKRGITDTMIVAINDATPEPTFTPVVVTPDPAPVLPEEPAPAPVVEKPVPAATQVDSVLVRHDGYFTLRAKETITLTLLDAQGDIIENPTFDRKMELRTAYGKAEFNPASLTVADFHKGKAEVQMLPFGQTTIVIQAQPFTTMAKPMQFER